MSASLANGFVTENKMVLLDQTKKTEVSKATTLTNYSYIYELLKTAWYCDVSSLGHET